MKRYTARQISALLGEARRRNGECKLTWCAVCCDLFAVVRQLRRELATRQETVAALNDELQRQTLVIERLKRDLAEVQNVTSWRPTPEVTK